MISKTGKSPVRSVAQRSRTSLCARRRRRLAQRGYTLIEICAVLFIMALIGGIALPAGFNLYRHETFLREVRDLEMAARLARHYAMESQQAEIIIFSKTGWQIQSASAALAQDKPATEERSDPDRLHVSRIELGYFITSESDNSMVEAEGFRWIFWPDGTTSPLHVQIATRDGSWVRLHFNPLTAFATEEASYMN